MKRYHAIHIWDYLFTLAVSVGFALNIMASFVISPELTANVPRILLIAGIFTAALFLFGRNQRTRRITGFLAGGTLLLVTFLLLRRGLLIETEDPVLSAPLFWMVLLITCTVTWLFTRSHRICVVFAMMSLVICGAFGFLEYPVSVPGLFLMAAGLIAELLLRNFSTSLEKANYGRFSVSHTVAQSLLVAALVILLSGGVYFGIVRPLHPPVADLKLITEQMSWDVVEKIGISSSLETENMDLSSNRLNDTLHKTNQKDDTQSDSSREHSDAEDSESKNDDMQKKSRNRQSAFSVSYDEQTRFLLPLILLVILAAAAPFAVKFWLRKRHRAKIESMPPAIGTAYLYHYFLRKFSLVHIARPQTATVLEYARDNARELRHFNTESGVDFSDLSGIYNRMVYGQIDPTVREYDLFKEYYDSFRPNIRRRMGKLRYAVHFWIL